MFYDEILKTVKTVLLAIILLAMFKIYENGGYSNPITIAVLIIMFSLWVLFRIELNEEVSQEISEENKNKQPNNNSVSQSQQSSNCTSPARRYMPLPIAISDKLERKVKNNTKYRRLVKSRSKSPDLTK